MTDEEIEQVYNNCKYEFGDTAGMFAQEFYRAIIAAYQAKLLAGVEMPEPTIIKDMDWYENEVYDIGDLQQYAAAAAAQAREKALDEAMLAVNSGVLGHGECTAAIESLKGKQA